MLEALAPPAWLAESYLWHAALADLHRRCGHGELARSHGAAALAQVPSKALQAVLTRRLGSDPALAGAFKAETPQPPRS
jgi:predicted RNA polymerase sigma factor